MHIVWRALYRNVAITRIRQTIKRTYRSRTAAKPGRKLVITLSCAAMLGEVAAGAEHVRWIGEEDAAINSSVNFPNYPEQTDKVTGGTLGRYALELRRFKLHEDLVAPFNSLDLVVIMYATGTISMV